MKLLQRAALVLILIAGLFPPWRVTEKNRANGHVIAARVEFAALWNAPVTANESGYRPAVQSVIAFDVLAVEWLLLGCVLALILFVQSRPCRP